VIETSNKGENAKDVLENFLQSHNLSKEDFNRNEQRAIITELMKTLVCKSGMSGRQVAEITGINREKVRKILVSVEPSL
jgi:DNA-binding phage protein